jgi:hypothetical protein
MPKEPENVDAGTRAFLAVRELAEEVRTRDGELTHVAETVAYLAIGALQGLRVGEQLLDDRQIAALRKACEIAQGTKARVCQDAIEHAGRVLASAAVRERRYAATVRAIAIIASLSVDPNDHAGLMQLAWPERWEATAELLATCSPPRLVEDGRARVRKSEPSKKGKRAAKQWESIAVELLVRAGILKVTPTNEKAKRKEHRQKFTYWAEKQ